MHKILTATLAAGVMATGIAHAVTTTTAATLAFPNYTPGGGAQIGNTSISVKCTKNTPFTVTLNAGSTTGDAFAQRLMGSGANTLQYNLYTSAALATIFGDGTGGTGTIAGTGLGVATANTVQVFGQVPDSVTNQAAVPGAYADTITVTVTY
jgi:spore coat protein U-like protein